MKRCLGCKEEKPETEFHKSKKAKDGLFCYCKTCNYQLVKQWKKDHPEGNVLALRKRRKEQPEKCRMIKKRYNEKVNSDPVKRAAKLAYHQEYNKEYRKQIKENKNI